MMEWLILALSLAGLVISLYFILAFYGRVKHSRWVPEILCAREGSTCVTVMRTPYARVFGVPNSLLGITYYLAVILEIGSGLFVPNRFHGGCEFIWPHQNILPASFITVVLGFYLVYALRRKLHVNCPLCYIAHAINLAIFVLLLIAIG
jgi:uncharacterized membrane protein